MLFLILRHFSFLVSHKDGSPKDGEEPIIGCLGKIKIERVQKK